MKKNAILLMGATASGKTNLALELSAKYPVEIISVDSALIYQDMDIGTAKPSKHDLDIVKHYLIDIITPVDSYSVAQFLVDANHLINDIISRNKIPLLVGGTMMYYNAMLNGMSSLPQSNPEIRKLLEDRLITVGLSSLYNELRDVDYIAASRINQNDKQRIMRALEVFYITKKPMSVLQLESNINLFKDINLMPLAIIPEDRKILHHRINHRFEQMLQLGFIDEVIALKSKYQELTISHNSMRCVGYKEVWSYLENQITYSELQENGATSTRQLAKRQITWLRSIHNVINLAVANPTLEPKILLNNLVNQIKSVIIEGS